MLSSLFSIVSRLVAERRSPGGPHKLQICDLESWFQKIRTLVCSIEGEEEDRKVEERLFVAALKSPGRCRTCVAGEEEAKRIQTLFEARLAIADRGRRGGTTITTCLHRSRRRQRNPAWGLI
ncbi:hypothetical protein MRB53_030735 [Persea americana]|uniref:Uncharacterized protein n=1 Tax=Persea americana TaxID=3435 RepID=A0ACC2KMD7_PERAE|nr:hypothetical protein MRB53_030735 [Persea americana]